MANLTDLAAVRQALKMTGTGDDVRVTELLSVVDADIQGYCGRDLFSATLTEYFTAEGEGCDRLLVNEWPITSVTSVHVSTDLPRVYDSTTLLTADEDYITHLEAGVIDRVDNGIFPKNSRATKVIYVGGYATIPKDLEWAAIECISYHLQRSKHHLHHLTSINTDHGDLVGVRFNIPDTARVILDRYRNREAS